jgi:hypothetical protein
MEPTEKRKFDGEDGDASNAPKKRVMGPAMPPTSAQPEHETAPASDGSDSDSESDDDFGPSLPPPDGISVAPVATAQPAAPAPEKENKRDEWMMAPPDGSDWASKIDPTQIRSRKFNTGRSARSGGSKELDSSWVETPEERMRRLGDAVMGVGAPSSDKQPKASTTARDKSMEERIKKFNQQSGKNTRLESSEARKEEDDDPSARAFDREKDMAVASKISNAKRREMVNKASDYSTRFTKGNYL